MTAAPRTPSPGLRRTALAVTLLLLGACCGTARASSLRAGESDAWAVLAVPAQVRSGDRLRLELAPPDGVEELEILLSVDGGRSYPVRVTPSLEHAPRTLEWNVPNLPAAEARLKIRFRVRGREIEAPPSAAFAIHGD